nr:hypothetical protein [Tanacetum cinerariifolium]
MASFMDPVTQSLLGSQSAPNVALTEYEQNVESGRENLGDYHVSLSDDEGNDVEFKSKETQSASKISNARRMARKAKETFIEDKAPKKKRTSGNNFDPSLDGIDQVFEYL